MYCTYVHTHVYSYVYAYITSLVFHNGFAILMMMCMWISKSLKACYFTMTHSNHTTLADTGGMNLEWEYVIILIILSMHLKGKMLLLMLLETQPCNT